MQFPLKTFVVAAALLLGGSLPGNAQQAGSSDPALQALSPEAQAAVERPSPALQQRTHNTSVGRVDTKNGVQRSVRRVKPLETASSSPEQAARRYLRRDHKKLGLPASLRSLQLQQVTQSPGGYHVRFQQVANGFPVHEGGLKVNLDRSLQPLSAYNSTYPHLWSPTTNLPQAPVISRSQAQQLARKAVSNAGAVSLQQLMVYPSKPARLVWQITAWPDKVAAEWVLLIDAVTGELVAGFNSATRLHPSHPSKKSFSTEASLPPRTAQPPKETTSMQTNGSGYVFDPDPVTTAGSSYGGKYVDQNDNTSPALEEELLLVPLPQLTQNDTGGVSLSGPFVQVVGTNPRSSSAYNYTPPVEDSPDAFRYTRDRYGFEAVNAYYHIDKSQRYLQSLGFTNRPEKAINVNPHGEGRKDNSFYYPGQNLISFGTGGIDDAEDGGVIWHEYAHAVLESAAPNYLRSAGYSERRAFHEGWADYWAGSYRRSLGTAQETVSPAGYNWRQLFPWDGHNEFWNGRYISHPGTYPASLAGNIYQDGLLWTATLMEIFTALEERYGYPPQEARRVLDQLNLQSHHYLPPPSLFTLEEAAHALVEADLQLHDGKYRPTLIERLSARGFVDPSTYGPRLTFSPPEDVQYANGALRFSVQVTGRAFAVEKVRVYYRRIESTGSYQRATLSAAADSLFTGSLTVNNQPGLIEYYLEAVDQAGVASKFPAAGAQQPLMAKVGTVAQTNLLSGLRSTGRWQPVNDIWQTTDTTDDQPDRQVSSLIFAPVALPENPDARLYFVLDHQYRLLPEKAAGNLKISTNQGRSWQPLAPRNDYPARTDLAPLQNEPVFTGSTGSTSGTQSVFNLSEYAGQQIQLRVDLAHDELAGTTNFWKVQQAQLYQATLDQTLRSSRKLTLHANYPDPFSTNTTVHFTLPSATSVTLELYDPTGRRVAVFTNRRYTAGTHTVTFGRANLANGIYFLRLVTDNQTAAVEPVRLVR